MKHDEEPVREEELSPELFNFCFPEGRELETTIVSDKDGRTALRVFWEQW